MATTVIEFAAELEKRKKDDPEFGDSMVTMSGSTLYLIVKQLAQTLERVERLERAYTMETKVVDRDADGHIKAIRTLAGPGCHPTA